MARMIPPTVPAHARGSAEEEVFYRLRDDPATRDWIVLHSLQLAEHTQRVMGEVDFVVIMPGLGVLCLEVKGCRHLSRRDGVWYYGRDSDPDPRGPFKQAAEAMHSLRRHLIRAEPRLRHVVFWSGVLFPYVEFDLESPEWHPWQVIDARLYRRNPLSRLCEGVLVQARSKLSRTPTARWFNPRSSSPTHHECEQVARLLRGNFEFFEPPHVRVERWHAEVKRYTEEQIVALDAMEANPRVIFKGPAGTGKTLLALEASRRGALQGKRVLFVCFNRLLGQWLHGQLVEYRNVKVTTIHRYMLEIAGDSPPREADRTYWAETLPELALSRLLEQGLDDPYDVLIVDEGQDILNHAFLDILDLSLRGGLSAGTWRVFGDFDRQTIYDVSQLSLSEFIHRCGGQVPIFTLGVNCRNTPRIATLVELLGGLRPGYSKVLRPDNQVEPTIRYYHSRVEQGDILRESIQELLKEGFQPADIVILSPRSEERCVASEFLDARSKDLLVPLSKSDGRDHDAKVRYGSIHSFKGLEAGAVILTDVEELASRSAQDLFYVGVTRALHRLVVLVHDKLRVQLREMLLAKVPMV